MREKNEISKVGRKGTLSAKSIAEDAVVMLIIVDTITVDAIYCIVNIDVANVLSSEIRLPHCRLPLIFLILVLTFIHSITSFSIT